MKRSRWRRVLWIGLVVAGIAGLLWAFQPAALPVDVAVVGRGTLRVTVEDDGRTRVLERYTITAPIEGRLLRTALDAGDPVRAHQTVVAEFEPVPAGLLDPRSRAEAEARRERAAAAVREAEARRDQAAADKELALSELQRARELAQVSIAPSAVLDRARRDEASARDGLRAAEFAVEVARFEDRLARASLGETADADLGADGGATADNGESEGGEVRLRLRSPIDGAVLRVFEESARSLPAGAPLLEVGNTARLEIVADYLTQDAVKIRAGMAVRITGWGGERADGTEQVLEGRVRVVEPGGFTKVSALGVEEQRVDVVVDPVGDLAQQAALGDGYRVDVAVVLWEQDDVLLVPTGALFRAGDGWEVFAVVDGHARRRVVELGRRSALQAEVVAGLSDGDLVVLYPSELLEDGVLVQPQD